MVVISYYLLALLKLALESADDAGFDVNTSLVLGIAIPVVLGLVFIGVRMIHHGSSGWRGGSNQLPMAKGIRVAGKLAVELLRRAAVTGTRLVAKRMASRCNASRSLTWGNRHQWPAGIHPGENHRTTTAAQTGPARDTCSSMASAGWSSPPRISLFRLSSMNSGIRCRRLEVAYTLTFSGGSSSEPSSTLFNAL